LLVAFGNHLPFKCLRNLITKWITTVAPALLVLYAHVLVVLALPRILQVPQTVHEPKPPLRRSLNVPSNLKRIPAVIFQKKIVQPLTTFVKCCLSLLGTLSCTTKKLARLMTAMRPLFKGSPSTDCTVRPIGIVIPLHRVFSGTPVHQHLKPHFRMTRDHLTLTY
jgi:hypothetical protein